MLTVMNLIAGKKGKKNDDKRDLTIDDIIY